MTLWNKVLVGVDEGPHSIEAVRYLAAVLGGSDTCRVRVVAVHRPPERDAFPDEAAWRDAAAEHKRQLMERLEEARRMLTDARLAEANVSTQLLEAGGRTVGESIMELQRQEGYGTVVVGRRGLSKAEEFLFGSVSSHVVHSARQCSVWVVA